MSLSEQNLREAWTRAVEAEDAVQVEALVRQILTAPSPTSLTAELRYRRGVLNLTEGEGLGSQRLARALAEFKEAVKAAEAVGGEAEPWRSLARTQVGACTARLGNLDGAVKELQATADYRPRSPAGHGALAVLADVLRNAGKEADAGRVDRIRQQYAEELLKETSGAEHQPVCEMIQATELLGGPRHEEALAILRSLISRGADAVGQEVVDLAKGLLSG